MFVRDVIADASEILGFCRDELLFRRLTDGIEVLANKGQFDPLLGYLDTKVTAGHFITLPREVECPLKLNINSNPAFSRSRIFEFTMNGPGSDMPERTNYAWEDRGDEPVLIQPGDTVPVLVGDTQVRLAGGNVADNGKKVIVKGFNAAGVTVQDTLVIGGVGSVRSYKRIEAVWKDQTLFPINLETVDSVLLSTYDSVETEPKYRRIRLTKEAAAVRMLFRRVTYKITSRDDYIPLHSKMSLVLMLKALEAFRKGNDNENATKLEKQAVQWITEEQQSRNAAIEMAQQSEEDSAIGLGINNRDSIIVADVYDEAAKIFGPIGRIKLFSKMTEAVELLSNESQWDGLEGYVDILTDCERNVTLPRYVETPLALNMGGRPMIPRNKFFEFHLNGPGTECSGCSFKNYDILGDVVTLRDPAAPQQLCAVAEVTSDIGKVMRVYGYDTFTRRLFTLENDIPVDGIPIIISGVALPDPSVPKIARIERIVKPETKGMISLYGYEPAVGLVPAVLTYLSLYYPDETEPSYKRIRLPFKGAWVRMLYRKRTLKIEGLGDPLHMKSKTAIVQMMQALKLLDDGKQDDAGKARGAAVGLMTAEQTSRNPNETFSFQFDTRITAANKRLRGIR